MRSKREKSYKRALRLYNVAFKFRAPYQILLDGNFIHQAVKQKVRIQEALKDTVSAEVRPMVTSCVLNELQALGKPFVAAYTAAKCFEVRGCLHQRHPVPAARCIETTIGPVNTFHYCVASQDNELRKRMRDVVGTPLFHFKRTVLIMEPVSRQTLTAAGAKEDLVGMPLMFESSIKRASEETDKRARLAKEYENRQKNLQKKEENRAKHAAALLRAKEKADEKAAARAARQAEYRRAKALAEVEAGTSTGAGAATDEPPALVAAS